MLIAPLLGSLPRSLADPTTFYPNSVDAQEQGRFPAVEPAGGDYTLPMLEIPWTFRSAEGVQTTGTATVFEYGPAARRSRMIIYIVVGVFAGTFCLIVPGPHSIGALIPPALGVWLGLRARNTRAKVLHASGPCPACEASTQWPGGALTTGPLTVPCPKCRAMVSMDTP